MNTPSSRTTTDRQNPAIERLLETVRGSGPHGQLLDVREALRPF